MPPSGALPAVWTAVESPDVIDPHAAAGLFESYWQLRPLYMSWGSSRLLATIEAGPALETDELTCGCGQLFWGAPLAYSVFLTRQTSFPAYFAVEARTYLGSNAPSDSALVVLLFERLAASSQWKVVIDSQESVLSTVRLTELDFAMTGPSGFDESPLINFPRGVGSLSARLASYMEYWARNWKAPTTSIFRPDYWTRQWIPGFVSDEKNRDPDTGDSVHFYFYPGQSNDAWVVPSQGWAIAFATVVYTKVSTNSGGWVVQDASRDQFAPTLAPGRYTEVMQTKVVQPWFVIFPDGTAYVDAINPTIVKTVGYGWHPL